MSGGHYSHLGAYLGTLYRAPERCVICGLDMMDGQPRATVPHPDVAKWPASAHATCASRNRI